jgi:2-dehydropantoate 2-reductase
MLGDVERRGRTEDDHIVGDLIRRHEGTRVTGSLLRLAYMAVKASVYRVARESASE